MRVVKLAELIDGQRVEVRMDSGHTYVGVYRSSAPECVGAELAESHSDYIWIVVADGTPTALGSWAIAWIRPA